MTSDRVLVAGVRARDPGAFGEIVSRYEQPLTGFARGRLRSVGAQPEDVVQDVFLTTYVRLRTTEAPMHLRGWLYRCAANACIDELRRPVHARLDTAAEPVECRAAETRAELRDIVAGLRSLPPRQSRALILRATEGSSYREIATQLGLTESAVKSLIHRGRGRLRAEIEQAEAA